MNEQLNRIKEKLEQLKQLDSAYTVFGSQSHQYKINPPISLSEVQQFETMYNVILPKEYVAFLTEIGNGGAGPYYGLEPFENALFDDLDYKRSDSLLDPSRPFLHTESWNLEFEPPDNEEQYESELKKFEEEYYNKDQMNGVLAICNHGCGISSNLVVNGQEYGHIWIDIRACDCGISPSHELGNQEKIGFLDWYELWLDKSINEIKEGELSPQKQDKKPWWKIW